MKRYVLVPLFFACILLPLHAYEYFTIYFSDGTKSDAFYAVDVDSICYSKISIDNIVYNDWQVQEIYTCDSVFRYPLAQIDSLSFKDVDINRVAEDIDRANIYIAPLYLQCSETAELASHLPDIKNIEGVENAWADHQTLFVKIRDYGTISYIYPPAMKAGGQFNYQKAPSSQSRRSASTSDEHHHVKMGKACIYNQTAKNEAPYFLQADSAFLNLCGAYECMGVACDPFVDLSPSFFKNEIFDYDQVFLITHGEYDSKSNLHWLYTSEEQFFLDIKDWKSQKQEWIEFLDQYSAYSSNQLGIGVIKEIRGGRLFAVYYTKVSEKYILSSNRHFMNSGNAIIFNVACQSLKGNDNMALAFKQKGAGCYLGYTETNDIGHYGGEFFFGNMLNAQCVGQAKESIPLEWQNETLVDKKTNEEIPVVLRKVLLNNEADNICIIDPETLEADINPDNGNESVTLKGQIKMLSPSLMDILKIKYEVGFILADNQEMNDTIHISVSKDYDEPERLMRFEKELDNIDLQSDKTYFYQAYMYDGKSFCYGEVKNFILTKPYCVLKDGTLTFYHDGMKEKKEGLIFDIADRYKSNQTPVWTWEGYRSQISTVVFDESFRNYYPGNTAYWFYNLEQLKAIIDMEYLNTCNVVNMHDMFNGCSSLMSLDLSHFDTRNVCVMGGLFCYCYSLTSLDLSVFNTNNVTDMGGMFYYCNSLTSLDLNNFNTGNVIYMSDMFAFCSSLTSLDVSNFDTSNVTNMASMFYSCKSLESLDLSSFNTSKVTNMANMFYDCSSLASLDLSSFNTGNVTNMREMFCHCFSLTSLDLSSFNTSNIVDMRAMFAKCTRLKSINLSGFDTSKVTDMGSGRSYIQNGTLKSAYGMFEYCDSLETLDLSHFDTSNVTNMANMFCGCPSLISLDLSSFNTSNVSNMANMFKYCRSLTSLYISSFNTSNVTNMAFMFSGCSSLTSLDLISFNTSNVTNMNGMFSGCSSLRNLDLSSFDTSNVTLMGGPEEFFDEGMFNKCSSLTNLDLSSFNTSNVTNMANMFINCSSLRSLDLSSFNTSNVTNMNGMFSCCSSLRSLDLSSFDTSNVTDMGSMFSSCDSLTYLDFRNVTIKCKLGFPGSLKSLNICNANTSEATDMGSMFRGCSSLRSLDLSSFDTSNVTNMTNMFYDCSSLISLDLSSFNTSNVTNMNGMFSCCSSLRSLDLSSFNTSNVTNMDGMFSYCSSLTSLDLSSFDTSNVTLMGGPNYFWGNGMFCNCSSLRSLDLSSFDTSNVTNMANMFRGCNSLITIYGKNWPECNTSDSMFSHCEKLTGGKGTKVRYYGGVYSCLDDSSAAHIDGGEEWPGLFTAK